MQVISLHDQIAASCLTKKRFQPSFGCGPRARAGIPLAGKAGLYLQIRVCKSCFNMAG